MVYGDATQLYQVLMNLCVNASHSMEPDREFTATDHELASIDAVIRKPFGTRDIAIAIRKIMDKINKILLFV